jgi:hypothetical protein
MSPAPITIRRSTPEDTAAIARIAALDSRRTPRSDALLAFSDSELRAVLPLDGSGAIADPFEHTAAIVDLLEIRAAHITGAPATRRPRLRALRLRAA